VNSAPVSLYLMAVVFFYLGATSYIATTNLPAVEIDMPTRIAVMEVRGVYGGFFFGTVSSFSLFARPQAGFDPGYSRKYRYLVGRPASDGRHYDGGVLPILLSVQCLSVRCRVDRRFACAPSSYSRQRRVIGPRRNLSPVGRRFVLSSRMAHSARL
jgi:hypothetical protein